MDAAKRYLDTDIVRLSRFDRIMEIHLDRQRQRDIKCGMQFADYLTSQIRDEMLFLTKGHPSLPLFKMLVDQLFKKMNVPFSLIDKALRSLRLVPYPRHELPIHPRIAEHLNLRYGSAEQRYRFHDEGFFTFEEFARRYVDYAWEPGLREAFVLANQGDNDRALALVQDALSRCPHSVAGWRLSGTLLMRANAFEDALVAIDKATALDPDDPENACARARLLLRWGRVAEAQQAADRAIELAPFDTIGHQVLIDILSVCRRDREAATVAAVVAELAPGNSQHVASQVHHLLRCGDLDAADLTLRRALLSFPESDVLLSLLADVLSRRNQLAEALDILRQLAAAHPHNPHYYGRIGGILQRSGDLPGAEAAFRRAIEIDSSIGGFHHQLAEVLDRSGRLAEALAVARTMVRTCKVDGHMLNRLANLLARSGEPQEAETVVRRAIALDPLVAGFRHSLSDILMRLDRHAEALQVVEELVVSGTRDPHILNRHAMLLLHAGDLERAAESARTAVSLDPSIAGFQNTLRSIEARLAKIARPAPVALAAG